jgi:tRNA (guanine-N7-)-methyltransferase
VTVRGPADGDAGPGQGNAGDGVRERAGGSAGGGGDGDADGGPGSAPAVAAAETAAQALARRHIRSFAMRRGHVTAAQRRAYAELVPALCLPYQAALLDPAAAFGRVAPLVLEIGFGMGETTARIAEQCPGIDFLGVEVFVAGIGALARRVRDAGLRNVRIIEHDAVEVVRDMIAPSSLDGAHIFFPDPWPKARHHKRRLVAQPFIGALAARLRPGGTLHCATDWQHYAEQMLAVLTAEPLLRNLHAGYAPAARSPLCERPQTKFHARGERLGHGVWDLVFERR